MFFGGRSDCLPLFRNDRMTQDNELAYWFRIEQLPEETKNIDDLCLYVKQCEKTGAGLEQNLIGPAEQNPRRPKRRGCRRENNQVFISMQGTLQAGQMLSGQRPTRILASA